jgi:hypothetical protein
MFADAYIPVNKEPWKGSKLADFILVSIPMVIFAAQLVYYLFSEDCTFGVLELGNDKIDLSDDPNCISTPVKQSINFIYTSFSANIFLSMDEIDVQNCVEQLYLNATVTTSIIHVGNETNLYAFWLYGNTGNQIFEIEAILNRWNTSNTFLDSGNEDIYLWFSAQMLCYYASDEWNEPYQCDRCTSVTTQTCFLVQNVNFVCSLSSLELDVVLLVAPGVSYGPIESIALSLPITSYAVTAVILMIQFLYPRSVLSSCMLTIFTSLISNAATVE